MRYEIGLRRMVQQLADRGIADERVLAAFSRVPRHLFVDEAFWSRAYGPSSLPIGFGQTISQPYVVARMAELLELASDQRVLELGTGSGFQTAILAEMVRGVFTVERIPWLADRARAVLGKLPYVNVTFRVADGTLGWPEFAPYDRIVVTAGSPTIPPPLCDQLAPGGRMVIPVGDADGQRLCRVSRDESGRLRTEEIEDVAFVKLLGEHGWTPDP